MKTIIYPIITIAILISCKREPHYVIKGNISGADNITFVLQKKESGKVIKLDSAVAVNGKFTIPGGSTEYPVKVNIVPGDREGSISFYLENSEIILTGKIDSLDRVKVEGSSTHDELMAYQDSINAFNYRINKVYLDLTAAQKAGDSAKVFEIHRTSDSVYASIYANHRDFNKKYIRNHPKSYIVPTILYNISYELDANEIESFINGLDPNVTKTPIIKDLKSRVAVMKTVELGKKAPDFVLNDINGIPLQLSSNIGKSKLLLIDFWASWCHPCRLENPNIVKVYNEFHNKGFDVFGVSLDQKKEDWINAIAEDKLTWSNVSDLQYWNSTAAKLYAIYSIPANFLVDETGTIVGRNLRGETLRNKVEELLQKR